MTRRSDAKEPRAPTIAEAAGAGGGPSRGEDGGAPAAARSAGTARTSPAADLVLALVVLLTFGGCLGVGLFADDFALLGSVAAGVDWGAPLAVGGGGYYRPLVATSLARTVEAREVLFQHGLNLLLHLLNARLVLGLARLAGCRQLPSLVLALLFATHPLVVTPVYWLSARGDLLCTALYLAGLLAFLRHLRGGGRGWLLATGATVGVAPLAKEVGLTLVAALAVLWLLARLAVLEEGWTAAGGGGQRGAGEAAAGRGTAAGGAAADRAASGAGDGRPGDEAGVGARAAGRRAGGLHASGQGLVPPGVPPSPARLTAAGRALALYGLLAAGLAVVLAIAFWRHAPSLAGRGPAGAAGVVLVAVNAVLLRIDELELRRWAYGWPALRWAGIAAGLLVAGLAAAVAVRLRGRRGLAELALLAALPLLPLVPLMVLGWARERHAYLPWALLIVALAVVMARVRPPAGITAVAGLVLLSILVPATLARGAVWQDNRHYLDRACASFRQAVGGRQADPPIVLLTYPFSRGEVPLYSNDAGETLHHCLHGGFGSLGRLRPLVPLVLGEPSLPPERTVERVPTGTPGVFQRRVVHPRAYFRLGHGHVPGTVLEDPGVRLTVTGVDPFGDVTGFRLALPPGAPAVVLDLGPEGFERRLPEGTNPIESAPEPSP